MQRIYSSRMFIRLKDLLNLRFPLYPSGHFHSSIPSRKDLKQELYFPLQDISVNVEKQLVLLNELAHYYKQLPFAAKAQKHLCYYYNNPYFSYSDAIICYCLIAQFRPSRIVELGSGYSTACMLDAVQNNKLATRINCYDLNHERTEELIRIAEWRDRVELHYSDVRNLDEDVFRNLKDGDILFVDTSHVSKYGSELHSILFKYLPILKPGVIIHFHDVFRHFEYPPSWLREGIYWNEQYLLRAFLQNNIQYEILLFSDLMEHEHEEWYKVNMPLCLQLHERYIYGANKGQLIQHIRGQSLWLRKKPA